MSHASLAVKIVPFAVLVLSGSASAQDAAAQPPPMDVFIQALFGVETMDACVERVQAGFGRAGYVNIVADAGAGTVKGAVGGGDTAGISSMVACIPAGQFSIALASAGFSSLGDFAPQTQNNRLLGAINQQ